MKNKLLYIGILAILSAGVYFLASYHNSDVAKCPDDFPQGDAGEAAQLASINKWTNDFYDAHPGASIGEWAEARHQFLIDNHCTAALQRYEQAKAGKADPATMERINTTLQEATGG